MRLKLAVAALLLPAALVAQARSGYLPSGAIDLIRVLPPAPLKGEGAYEYDRKLFKATRKLLGTPRGAMATADVPVLPGAMFGNFACSLGVTLTPESAPRLTQLIAKTGIDANTQSATAKQHFKRLRPYQIDKGLTCQTPKELEGSYDYPSGHTTWGWTWGLLLAELAPDRATPLLARARAYGESRLVCGVHNASAIEAGRITASVTVAAVHARPTFQADLTAARDELAKLRADPATPRPQGCEAEAALVARSIYLR